MGIVRQCRTLSVHCSGLYSRSRVDSEMNLKFLPEMEEFYLIHPLKGAKRMHIWLTRDRGYKVGRNWIERLYYRVMGLLAVLP